MIDAGTRPNCDSAENRPLKPGGFTNTSPYPREGEGFSSAVLVSVMVMKRRPVSFQCAADIRLQKNFSSDATSTMPPLLLATTNHVRSGFNSPTAPAIALSSVVSSTNSRGYP